MAKYLFFGASLLPGHRVCRGKLTPKNLCSSVKSVVKKSFPLADRLTVWSRNWGRGFATSRPSRVPRQTQPKNLCSSVKSVVKKSSPLNRYVDLATESDGVGDGLDDLHVLQALGETRLGSMLAGDRPRR